MDDEATPAAGAAPGAGHRGKARALFWLFFKVSLFTLGGGYAMVPIAQRKLADAGLLGAEEFYAGLAIAQSLPGPIIFNTAFIAGSRVAGHAGAFLAALAVIIPPVATILAAALLFDQVAASPYARGFVKACYGTVLGFVASLAVKIARSVRWRWAEVALAAAGTAAAFLFPGWILPAIIAVGTAAYLGRRG